MQYRIGMFDLAEVGSGRIRWSRTGRVGRGQRR